jgi:hypothetical protein
MALEFFVLALQGCLVGLDLVEAATDFRRSLGSYTAVLVEFNWTVVHRISSHLRNIKT